MKALIALLRRDLRLALRHGGGAGMALGFFLAFIVLLPLGLGPDQALLARISPGVLWIGLLLSVLLSADQIFSADFEDGSLEIMAISPTPMTLICFTKALAHWLTAGLPLTIIAPILGFLINLPADRIIPQLLAMIAGSLGLSLLAALGAAVTVGLRKGGPLVSLLILPLYVPVLIFGVGASSGGSESSASLLMLLAFSLAGLALCPAAAAAAIRSHLR